MQKEIIIRGGKEKFEKLKLPAGLEPAASRLEVLRATIAPRELLVEKPISNKDNQWCFNKFIVLNLYFTRPQGKLTVL